MGKTPDVPEQTLAYFSMEIAIVDEIPTFSGGLGVLAGDFLRSAADLGAPLVAVTLLYNRGFFRQILDEDGRQVELPVEWQPSQHLERLDAQVMVTVAGREVAVGVWTYTLEGVTGRSIPIYFLDTNLEENNEADRHITDQLYAGGPHERLIQETILGVGGLRALRTLGYDELMTFHMNEGHAALLPAALLQERLGTAIAAASELDLAAIRDQCVFTTHTPVPAGHDRFELGVVESVLGAEAVADLSALGCLEGDWLNMTLLGMFFSGFINGVAYRHGEVSRVMFPQFRIDAITNGIHVGRWTADAMSRVFDAHLAGWREDNAMLRYAGNIPLEEIVDAKLQAKRELLSEVATRCGLQLDASVLTIGSARRATSYKRNDLVFSDIDELREIAEKSGPLQLLFSGKAHPNDHEGKELIAHITGLAKELSGAITVVYLPDYGMNLARMLVSGVDVWLNTPVARQEASGTSGMKAAVNGVPSLSVLDGWWVEGWVENVTGWAIGGDHGAEADESRDRAEIDATDGKELRRMIAEVVAPMYYERPGEFAFVARSAIALNGSFFNTHRMAFEYMARAYRSSARAIG
jgi:starch phosphorylase